MVVTILLVCSAPSLDCVGGIIVKATMHNPMRTNGAVATNTVSIRFIWRCF